MQKSATEVGKKMSYRRSGRQRRQISSVATRSFAIRLKPPLSPKQVERQFELAKLDYERLGTQEQNIINRRGDLWSKVAAILALPTGVASLLGLKSAIYPLMVLPFLIACLSLEVKHEELVVRYDVRKSMKELARRWGFKNHDAQYSKQEGRKRWWAGFYKPGRAAALVIISATATGIVVWSYRENLALSIFLTGLNLFFIIVTAWCML